jgi:RNA polymerase sigma factor (sigma-70 family)
MRRRTRHVPSDGVSRMRARGMRTGSADRLNGGCPGTRMPLLVMVSDTATPGTGADAAEALLRDREQVEKLIGMAYRRFGIRRADAEEVLAETLLELSASHALVENPGAFAFRIFYVRCCRWLEREGRSRVETAGLDPSAGRGTARSAPGVEWTLALKQGFARLSPVCRRLLTGYYVEGLSLKETAETTGHSSKQVWKRLDECLRRLKQCLQA